MAAREAEKESVLYESQRTQLTPTPNRFSQQHSFDDNGRRLASSWGTAGDFGATQTGGGLVATPGTRIASWINSAASPQSCQQLPGSPWSQSSRWENCTGTNGHDDAFGGSTGTGGAPKQQQGPSAFWAQSPHRSPFRGGRRTSAGGQWTNVTPLRPNPRVTRARDIKLGDCGGGEHVFSPPSSRLVSRLGAPFTQSCPESPRRRGSPVWSGDGQAVDDNAGLESPARMVLTKVHSQQMSGQMEDPMDETGM